MAETRNSYLVSKALKTFMFASVLASLAQRLATMTDAIVVSNLIGPDGISAINVVTPIITLFPTISILFGIGGSILAAKAIGRRDAEEANRAFTLSLLASVVSSLVLTVILFLLTPQIVSLVCPSGSRFYNLAVEFMHIMALSAIPTVVGFTLQSFVKTDGHPRLVMVTVMSSTALNLVLDFVFIKFFGMGIAGSAWGTIICFIFSMSVCIIHLRSRHSSFHLDWSVLKGKPAVLPIIKEGAPMSLNTLMMGACIFGFNSIVMHALGEDGMYIWAVCLQLLLIAQLMLGGVGSTVYSIGGMLIGERDMPGLNILIRRVLTYVGIGLLALTAIVEVWPQAFSNLFGGGGSGVSDMLNAALRIFAFVLVPYAILSILGALYQLLGYRTASLVISIGQLAVMVVCVWIFARIGPGMMWWGYPASAILLIIITLATTWVIHLRRADVAAVTLIPQAEEAKALNFSVRLTDGDVEAALDHIDNFLQECDIARRTSYNVRLCSEELLYNIVRYAVKRHPERHFIDVHIRRTDSLVTVLLKDDGRPFNPILKETPSGLESIDQRLVQQGEIEQDVIGQDVIGEQDEKRLGENLGLRLANGACQTMTYKYMYDQNMVYMTFKA